MKRKKAVRKQVEIKTLDERGLKHVQACLKWRKIIKIILEKNRIDAVVKWISYMQDILLKLCES